MRIVNEMRVGTVGRRLGVMDMTAKAWAVRAINRLVDQPSP